jgi:hypothetical protein
MATTRLTGTLIKSGSIPTTALGGGVVTSSAQIAGLVPGGTVSSSAQVDITATTNYSTFSSSLSTVDARQQVSLDALNSATSSYAINSTIQSQLAGVASSSSQVKEYLPLGTISASNQIDITATTNYATFSSSIATKNDTQDISINALNAATSSYALQTQLAGVASSSSQVKNYLPTDTVSSSTQVVAFLPTDTVSSSAQYPGWVTSSTQITQALPTGTVSSSAQYPGWVTASSQIDYNSIVNKLSGVVSSSEQIQPLLPTNTVSSSTQVINNIQNQIISPSTVYTVTIDATTISGSTVSGSFVGDGSGLRNIGAAGLPGGVVSASSQYPGWVTASSQIDYNSIQNKLSGVVSSSTQVQPLLPGGTVSSSGQVDITTTSGYSTFSSSLSTVDTNQQTEINALKAVTSSYAINSTIQSQLANVVSSSVLASPSQGTVRLTINGAVTDVDTGLQIGDTPSFTGLDSSGSINLASNGQIRVLNDAESTLFGFFNGSSILGAYYQMWGNNHASPSQRGTAEFVFDTRNSGGAFHIAGFDGATWTRRLTVDRTGLTSITGSLQVVGPLVGSLTGSILSPGVVSSSTQVVESLPVGTVSSSAQYPGWVTASSQIQLDAITGTTFSNAAFLFPQNVTLGGDLIVSGNDIRNNRGDDVITFRGTNNLDVRITSGALDVWSGEVRNGGTTAIQMNGQNVEVKGRLNISGNEIRSDVNQTALTLSGNNISTPGSASATGGFVGSLTGSILSPGVVSSSAQYPGWVTASSQIVWSQLGYNTGIVSSSNQVDITATTGYSTFSSSLATVDATQQISINALNAATSSYALQSQLAGVASSSSQVKAYLPDGTVSSSAQYPGWVTASSQVVVQNTTGIGALATTGSNVFTADQTITGSLFISQNLTVLGSSSISYISQSTLNIGTNVITVNTNAPGTRFGGLEVIDSGSSPLRSGSIYFDSVNDQWIFVHQNTVGGTTSSVVVMGPPTFNNIGNETLLTQNRVLKSNGLEHITDSQITDNGITVSITNGLSVGTNVSASGANISGLTGNQAVFTDANDNLVSNAITGTGNVVMSASPTLTGTLTAANITATGTMLLAGIFSSSAQVDYNSIQNKLSGVVSSSGQVQPLLPGGTVSSSAQYPGWVTASSQIDYNSITNKLSGVVSSSTQVQPLLPGGTVSSSGQVDITATTNYATFSSSIATKNNLQDVSINALNAATSSYAINSTIQSQLAGVISSSAQTVASIANQTIAPTTVNATTINASVVTASALTANQAVFTNASDGLVSNAITGTGNVVMSASPTLTGTITAQSITATGTMLLAGIVSQSSQIDYNSITNKLSGVYSSSVQTVASLSGQAVTFSGSQFSGIVSGSGLQYRLVVPVGTNYYAT